MTAEPIAPPRPSDAVVARLDDPVVADNLLLLLDNIDSLAFLAMGLSGLLERGDTLTQSLAEGVAMLRPVDGEGPDLEEVQATTREAMAVGRSLLDNAHQVTHLLESEVLSADVVDVLSDAADALVEARQATARRSDESLGPVALVRTLRDPDLQRGLRFVLEVGRALGRRTPGR